MPMNVGCQLCSRYLEAIQKDTRHLVAIKVTVGGRNVPAQDTDMNLCYNSLRGPVSWVDRDKRNVAQILVMVSMYRGVTIKFTNLLQ